MSMYSLTSSKFNPYRQGVLIGNFVEDNFGLSNKLKQMSQTVTDRRNEIKSESQDKYRWPYVTPEMFHKDENELTMTCNSNFDLDVDFTRKNLNDFEGLKKKNEYVLDNKNSFLPAQIKSEYYQKKYENEKNNIIPKDNIYSSTQRTLKKFHMADTMGVLYSRKNGLVGNLLFGHGCQKNFNKCDMASNYHLSYNKHIPTETYFSTKFKLSSPYHHVPKASSDGDDWDFRKFRAYGPCTKKFDKKKNDLKNFDDVFS